MKKMVLVTAVLLSFFIIIMKSDADMKITPSGVTSPDDSAAIHLSGDLTTGDMFDGPDGALISGVNTYSSTFTTYGGYFEASGAYGKGIYGSASGTFGTGVYGSATGSRGRGVCGFAWNTGDVTNYGGYFEAKGTDGRGVYGAAPGTDGMGVFGYAGNSADVTNYGGYFLAKGSDGRGVYGYAGNSGDVTNYGGYFKAEGTTGRGVYGSAPGDSGSGVYGSSGGFEGRGVTGWAGGAYGWGVFGNATGDYGRGVCGSGKKWDFYAHGVGGNYGPFTGAHEVKFSSDMPEEIVQGMIVSTTGKTEARKDTSGRISLSSTLPTVTLSTKANDKAVFGVIVSEGVLPKDHWYDSQETENFGVVNALGEGRVWVTNRNGNIENGDYITTSEIPGHGMLQNDDLLHSYTLGKSIETVDWEQVTETVQHDGESYKRSLIAVVYTSG